ncbi:MAG: competence/damage-inducible protein A [Clostridia bacterium]
MNLTAEVIAVGTELLMGQIVNTNAQFISEKLAELGVSVLYQTVVGDNPERLRAVVEQGKSRSDILVFTGGLGPTDDDLTKETIASVFGKTLELHEPSLEIMKKYVAGWDKNMPANNIKQAYLPKDGIVIPNHNGTAPGCIMEDGSKAAILLPGPPSEMKPMFEETVMPYLRSKSEYSLYSRVLRIFGIGESAAALQIDDMIKNQTNPTIAPYAKEAEVTFRITAMAKNEEEAEEILRPTVERMYREFGDHIYAEGDDASMVSTVVELLRQKGKTLATAESCTGGMIGRQITSVPGASQVYGFGFITYANEAKEKLLGVKRETLAAHGAVSPETAREMAEGARRVSGADIAVAVTGIAGPDGGTPEKPVGLVYVGISSESGTRAVKLNLSGNRERIRIRTCLHALDLVRRELLK